ncbi:MAG: Hsp33 family molecular chaperone HslO [Oscillospiraceae bacterium]|nr:Hsp33 family molecular chaperone HslO [Oscillospiraceae bacterium]
MDKIIRCITSDGGIMAIAVDASDIVFTAKKLHNLSSSAAAALGRLLCASSMMGDLLKQKDATMNLRLSGGGPLGVVVAVADSRGNVRGYVGNGNCPTEYYENGKINVAKAVGKDGVLNVMRDYGSGDPYIGQVPIVSGEIAEDIANYYATSEQIPTVCSLGVLLDKNDGEVLLAGGLLVQLLPGADEETVSKLEKNAQALEPMTTMLAKGMSVLDICEKVLEGFEIEVLDENPVNYVCTCSKERVRNALQSLSKEELKAMIEEDGKAEASCHFCNKTYCFNRVELQEILDNKK